MDQPHIIPTKIFKRKTMNTSEEGRKMRSLIDIVNDAKSKHTPKFKPKASRAPVCTVLGKFADYDEVYDYNEQNIDLVISEKIVHANYRFGYMNDIKLFVVFYVGRADNGLLQRMRQHWSDFSDGNEFKIYQDRQICFSFEEQTSETETYYRECEEYHRFDDGKNGQGEFLNKIHPAIPKYSDDHCHICGVPNN